jgi:hypothetical protein
MSQSDIAEYNAKRAAFINNDRALRPDYANAARRSAVEIAADRVIRDIRAFEASYIWDGEHENIQHPFPGMEFLTGASVLLHHNIIVSLLCNSKRCYCPDETVQDSNEGGSMRVSDSRYYAHL